MRGRFAALFACLALGACSQGIEGVDNAALTDAVGRSIGDPNTCVLLLDKAGEVAWRYGTHMTCARELPSCEGQGRLTVEALGKLAAAGEERAISCPSLPDGSTSVGWAAGPVTPGKGAKHDAFAYAAVMEGERALPGREIKTRLESALASAGL